MTSGYGPNPGYGPQQPAPPQKQGLGVGAIVLIVIGVMVVLGGGTCATCVCLGAKGISDAKQAQDDANAKAKASAVSVSVSTLLAAYKANEVSADASYKGKYVHASGGIAFEIRKTIGDQAQLWINASGNSIEHPIIQCNLTKAASVGASRLSKGSKVTVTGKVAGMIGSSAIGSVFLENCEF